jgi:hypothetical protein
MLVFTSYCRATIDTDAPGTRQAATISRFSASGHNLLIRLRDRAKDTLRFLRDL